MNNFDYWSTCAYLIDRVVMKDIVDKVIYEKNGWINFKLIAGKKFCELCAIYRLT